MMFDMLYYVEIVIDNGGKVPERFWIGKLYKAKEVK